MRYQILRVKKIKSIGGVAASAAHNTRERTTVNAFSGDLGKNLYREGDRSKEAVLARFRERLALDGNPRKNAVYCLDYLVSASNGALSPEERDDYLKRSLKWVMDRHGAENVVQATIHKDENTDAHMHVLVIPLAKNPKGKWKLRASKWLDGREKLKEMQDEFHSKIAKKYNLDRGEVGSTAKHEKVRRFYGMVNEPPLSVDKIKTQKQLMNFAEKMINQIAALTWAVRQKDLALNEAKKKQKKQGISR